MNFALAILKECNILELRKKSRTPNLEMHEW
jgi:hypothetical protein